MVLIEDIGEIRKFRLARTLLGRGFYFTAAYWVDGLMIDTGCAHTVRELVAALEESSIERIVNTHSHEDHIGANAALKRRFGAEILAHPLGLPVLKAPHRRQPLKPYQVIMWGSPEPSQGTAIGDEVETEGYRFQVIHTPGHSPDHICLYEPDRGWLFTGDTYIGGRDQALRADYNVWQIISSLRNLAELEVSLLFTGSGSVHKDARVALLQKIDYLEQTGERVIALHRRGLRYGRIRRKLFGPEQPISYLTLGNFSGKNLIRSFVEDQPTG